MSFYIRDRHSYVELAGPAYQRLLGGGDIRAYAPGDVIVSEEEVSDALHLIVSGEVHVRYQAFRGQNVTINAVFGDNSHFGGPLFLQDSPFQYEAVARTSCRVLRLNAEHYERYVKTEPDLLHVLLMNTNSRLAFIVNLYYAHLTLSATGRIALAILTMVETYEFCDGEPFPATQEEIRNLSGVSIFSVQRSLTQMKVRGIIQTGYKTITVRNRELLERVARDDMVLESKGGD